MTDSRNAASDKRGRIAAGALLALGAGASMWFASHGFPEVRILSGQQPPDAELQRPDIISIDLSGLDLDIADTEPLRRLGLGGRDALSDNAGMLFVFPTSDRHGFWMKGMRFPLDIIWISDGTVVDIVTLSPPYPGLPIPPSHTPKADADLVLELNAGKAAELGIREGVRVSFE